MLRFASDILGSVISPQERVLRASILIIDDDAALREVLRVGLEAAGHTVRDMKNGREGIRAFRKAPCDLVITDIYMPERDGLELIEALRRTHPHVKIMAMSGASGTMDYLNKARLLGAVMVMQKPFVISALLNAVAELIREAIPPVSDIGRNGPP
ncbi:MAG: Signal transduction response regulator, receiver domain [Nitrospira sp.]|jgi:DNA-binding response OmpR family regulator|nr:Signal transduction response regulator, receiver domain [Nitrospira sp.]